MAAPNQMRSSAATKPRIRRIADNEELARATTRYMVGNLEWSGVVFAGATLLVSAINDQYSDAARTAVYAITFMHLLVVPIYLRGFGPLALGGWWALIYPVQAVGINALLAVLTSPGQYGNNTICVPGCNYSGSMWLFLAYYPWLPIGLSRWRTWLEAVALASYFGYFIILIWLKNGEVTLLNVESALVSFLWLALAYVLGKAMGRMCLAAAEKQLEVQQQNFAEFFDFLHSHVKSGIAAAKIDIVEPQRVLEKLDELENVIGEYRVELLLAQEQIPLAALLSERIRTFAGVLHLEHTPRVGALTVERSTGILIGRALGDLLKNAAKYGALTVSIGCGIAKGSLVLDVEDDGPGFPSEYLDDPSRSLYRLRAAARRLGGDLSVRQRVPGPGVVLTLTASLSPRKGRANVTHANFAR